VTLSALPAAWVGQEPATRAAGLAERLDIKSIIAMTVRPKLRELRTRLSRVADGLAGVVEELQEISRGIHPAVLARGALAAALKTLARRSAVPVQLEVRAGTLLPEPRRSPSIEVQAPAERERRC